MLIFSDLEKERHQQIGRSRKSNPGTASCPSLRQKASHKLHGRYSGLAI
jgi:hypothetical protein